MSAHVGEAGSHCYGAFKVFGPSVASVDSGGCGPAVLVTGHRPSVHGGILGTPNVTVRGLSGPVLFQCTGVSAWSGPQPRLESMSDPVGRSGCGARRHYNRTVVGIPQTRVTFPRCPPSPRFHPGRPFPCPESKVRHDLWVGPGSVRRRWMGVTVVSRQG